MRKVLILIGIIVIISIGGFLVYQNLIKKENSMPQDKTLTGKKVAIIIAFRDFRDEEYFVPKEILERAGVEVKTASSEPGTAIGKLGGEAEVNLTLKDLKPADFDAVLFIGGPGAPKYLDNEISYNIARQALGQGKVLAAICISPTILAKAGVLAGKKATVWSSVLDKSGVKILEENNAVYQDKAVVVDGKIVTANGPDAAKEFGQTIVELLTKD